eukprot:428989-Lingulodinium_polyedra.AAC.1
MAAQAAAATRVDPQLPRALPPREGGAVMAFSDGACDCPQDPLLARAAWAVHIPGAHGGCWAGPADGAQTAQR